MGVAGELLVLQVDHGCCRWSYVCCRGNLGIAGEPWVLQGDHGCFRGTMGVAGDQEHDRRMFDIHSVARRIGLII